MQYVYLTFNNYSMPFNNFAGKYLYSVQKDSRFREM